MKPLYGVRVTAKRGGWYYAPSKEVASFYRLRRDAAAAAESESTDDSVEHCYVVRIDSMNIEPLLCYREGRLSNWKGTK